MAQIVKMAQIEKPNTHDIGYTLVPNESDDLFNSICKTNIVWHEFPKSIVLNITGLEPQILTVGDFITFRGRDGGAIIVKFYGYKNDAGPQGMSYLPWRDDPDRENGRWASKAYSLRGDARYIICPPTGLPHYGLHIDWTTIKNINYIAPTSNSAFQSKLHSLRNPERERP
jgi:hypothetical protein